MTIVRDAIRDRPEGDPIAGQTVTLHQLSNGSQLDTTTTDATGAFELETDLNPGPMYWQAIIGEETIRHSTQAIMPVHLLDLAALVPFQTVWTNGINPNYGNGFAVTTSSGMNVAIGSGAAIIDGMVTYAASGRTQAITAAHSTLGRLDLIYLAAYGASATEPGKFEIGYLAGTPHASPQLPTPTVTNGNYIPLAQITVDAGVTSIAGGKIADIRPITAPTGAGLTLEQNNSVLGTIPGIDVKSPLYATWYDANTPADIGIHYNRVTPIRAVGYGTSHASISSGTSDVELTLSQACTLPALANGQQYKVVVFASINGEGVSALTDGFIGVQVGGGSVTRCPVVQRWEHGVDGTHVMYHTENITGSGADVSVKLYYARSTGTIDFKYYGLDATATPFV